MNQESLNRSLMLAISLIALGLLAGCSRPAPEEQLIEAVQDVEDMQSRLEFLAEEIDSHEEALEQLRKERQRARAKLMTLEERLQRRATDLAIFRAAQSALLEDDGLKEAAVSASVEDGVVTLTGSVSSAEEERIATGLVRAVPGVESTVSRLQIIGGFHADADEN